MAITTSVLLFARYADELGASSVTVSLPDGATARDVLAAVRALPGAERLPPAPRVAVNQRFAEPADPVKAGDELAIIPPVAGG
jgi:molybdopterin converting factor subunit 1